MSDEFGKCGNNLVIFQPKRGRGCGWPDHAITWAQNVTLPGLSAKEIEDAFKYAFDAWAQVCDVRPSRIADITKANLAAHDKYIDGVGNVLAYCYMPCGLPSNAYSLELAVDNSEANWSAWTYDQLRIVLAHEIGHGLGLDHLPNGNLMQPVYSRSIERPQAGDIQAIKAIYGSPTANPLPAPTTPDRSHRLVAKGWVNMRKVAVGGFLTPFGGTQLPPLPNKPPNLRPDGRQEFRLAMLFDGKPYQFHGLIEDD